ncbi:hypothetical protein NVP1063O_170 [Vibrio phage 1.063.O._10N.261.45.C7]|nr:hypothetical protein NVP1063O_170 [Vibrio phage 1.063.O._10N.261.45.C7]
MKNDLQILLENAFTKLTEHGKLPVTHGEFINKISYEERLMILNEVLEAANVFTKEEETDV